MFNTPIGLTIFNRPDLTKIVLDQIRKVRPSKLFISADGPRTKEEALLCKETRNAINVDWPCEVHLNYSDVNLGCEKGLEKAFNWIFSLCDEAVLLEDDVFPDDSFFWFCQELLEKYRDNPKVMQIAGNNFRDEVQKTSYYFSRIPHVGGSWATWRRAWALYDGKMESWWSADTSKRKAFLASNCLHEGWLESLNATKKIDTWDYPWFFSIWNSGGISISPSVNLVKNIGFDARGTHTSNPLFNMAHTCTPLTFPLTHPKDFQIDVDADKKVDFARHFESKGRLKRSSDGKLVPITPIVTTVGEDS